MSDDVSIGLRVYLEDAASAGLQEIANNLGLFSESAVRATVQAGEGFDKAEVVIKDFGEAVDTTVKEVVDTLEVYNTAIAGMSQLDVSEDVMALTTVGESVNILTDLFVQYGTRATQSLGDTSYAAYQLGLDIQFILFMIEHTLGGMTTGFETAAQSFEKLDAAIEIVGRNFTEVVDKVTMLIGVTKAMEAASVQALDNLIEKLGLTQQEYLAIKEGADNFAESLDVVDSTLHNVGDATNYSSLALSDFDHELEVVDSTIITVTESSSELGQQLQKTFQDLLPESATAVECFAALRLAIVEVDNSIRDSTDDADVYAKGFNTLMDLSSEAFESLRINLGLTKEDTVELQERATELLDTMFSMGKATKSFEDVRQSVDDVKTSVDEATTSTNTLADTMSKGSAEASTLGNSVNTTAQDMSNTAKSAAELKAILDEDRVTIALLKAGAEANDVPLQIFNQYLEDLQASAQSAGMSINDFRKMMEESAVEAQAMAQDLGVFGQALDDTKTKEDDAKDSTEGFQQKIMALQMVQQGFTQANQFVDRSLQDIVTSGGNLEEAFTRVQIATQTTGKTFEDLKATIISAANKSVFSSEDIAAAFAHMADRGFTAKEIMNDMSGAAINLAEATGTQVLPASDLLIAAMRDYRATADQAKQYSDMLTYSFEHGIPSLDGMSEALDSVGGTAHELGIPFSQLIATLDYLTNNGMPNASQAGNSLRYMLTSLTNPTAGAAQEMSALGLISMHASKQVDSMVTDLDAKSKKKITWDGTEAGLKSLYTQAMRYNLIGSDKSFNQWAISVGAMSSNLYDGAGKLKSLPDIIQAVSDAIRKLPKDEQASAWGSVFNVESGTGAKLMGNDPKIGKTINAGAAAATDATKGEGQAAKDAKKMLADYNTALGEMKTSFHDLIGTMGMSLLPMITPIIGKINGLISMLQGPGGEGARKFVLVLLGVSAVVLPIGLIAISIALIATVMGTLAAPILIVVGVIALLILGVTLLIVHWKSIITFLKPVIDLFKHIGDIAVGAFHSIADQSKSLFGPITSFKELGKTAVDAFKGLMTSIQPVMPMIANFGKILKAVFESAVILVVHTVVGAFLGLWAGISLAIKGAIQAIQGIIQFIMGFIAFLGAIGTLIHEIFTKGWGKAFSDFGDNAGKSIKLMATGIGNIFVGLFKLVIGIVEGAVAFLVGAIDGFITGFINFFKHLFDVLVGHSIIPDLIRSIVSWLMKLPNEAIQHVIEFVTMFIGFIAHLESVGVSKIKSVISSIVSEVGKLGSQLLQSGTNAMAMFGQGISSSINAVLGPVENVASKVKSLLGFKSPPKSGPLSDSDVYMGNMMRMFGTGITANAHHVTNAVTSVASGIHSGITSPAIARIQAQNSYANGRGGAQSNNVTIQIGDQQVANLMINNLTGQLQLNGLARSWR